jgi:hypothetical protein
LTSLAITSVGNIVLRLQHAQARHFRRQPLAVGPLLGFHFEIQHCAERVEALGSHSTCHIENAAVAPPRAEVSAGTARDAHRSRSARSAPAPVPSITGMLLAHEALALRQLMAGPAT